MCDDVDIELGRRLRARRRLLGMTQQELASVCGVRFQQIQKYECAANRMSASVLWKLSGALGVEPGYFFTGLSHDSVIEDSAPVLRKAVSTLEPLNS